MKLDSKEGKSNMTNKKDMLQISPIINGFHIDSLVGKDRPMIPVDTVLELENHLRRELVVSGEIDSEMTDYIGFLIRRYNHIDKDVPIAERKKITLYINSPGGDIFATMSLVDVMKSSKTPIVTVNTGEAMSGACLILISGDERFTYKSAVALIHKGSISLGGNISDTEEFMEFYKKYQSTHYKDAIVGTTLIGADYYDKQIRKEWFLDSDDMIEFGLVDGIWEGI